MRLSLKWAVEPQAKRRPYGYKEELLASGTLEPDGDTLDIPDAAYEKLKDKYREDGPTLADMARNFTASTAAWVAAGRPVVSRDEYERRIGPDGCGGCPNWDPEARAGRGKCAVCGCTDLKLWLATDECPLPEPQKRWRKVV